MWNEIVRVVAVADGAPVYCDSCHDGALFHLDRTEAKSVAAYMHTSMVDGLKRVDGRAHDCTTCHGDPPDFHFIATWKATPAPNIVSDLRPPHDARASQASEILRPVWPTEGIRDPSDCGSLSERCPLGAWMRLVVAPAFVAERREELGLALDYVARYAPSDQDFVATAQLAAADARRGDFVAARAACGRCHAARKKSWRELHRASAPP